MLSLTLSLIVLITGCQSETTHKQSDVQATQAKEVVTNQPVYKVAVDSNYAPFEFKNEAGNVVGYDIDLIQAIAKEEGFKVEIIPSEFNRLLPAIESKKHDIAISAIKLSDSRQKKFLASDPYLQTHEGYVVKDNSPFKSIDDLKGQTVAVLGDSHLHEKLEVDQNTKVITEPTIFLAFKSIFMNEADAVYSEEPILHFEANQFPNNPVRFIPSNHEANKYVIYTNKDNQELMLKINNGLQTLKDNGKYHQLTEKWFADYASEVETL